MPDTGETIILVPEIANAQGRGVYCAEVPDFKYVGGEHFRKELDTAPVFLIPMTGRWTKGVLKKKENAVVYHSESRAIVLRNLHYTEAEQEGLNSSFLSKLLARQGFGTYPSRGAKLDDPKIFRTSSYRQISV